MSTVAAARHDVRATLRDPGDALSRSPIGAVPMLWINSDEARPSGLDATTILDEIARTGYEGTQLGNGFPEGAELRDELARRDLRLAEVYVPLSATVDGPTAEALDVAIERIRLLRDGGGEVLCVALHRSPGRDELAGRATAPVTLVLTDPGWDALIDLLHNIADRADQPIAFHPHGATFIETPEEVDRLVASTDPSRVGICLDVGHHLVGGGDPVAALRDLGDRVTHVHLKDVDPVVLAQLRSGALDGLGHAVRERLFTELGAGMLDLDGVIEALSERDYNGWLMVEQDSTWGPPSESAAIGRRVLATTLRRHGRPATKAGARA